MILVTGGTGLVGAHLLYQLTLKHDAVVAMYRKPDSLEAVRKVFGYYTKDIDVLFTKITWKQADIIDIPSLQEIFKDSFTQVYHCAALISFDPKDYYELRKVNIKGTANMVNLSIKNKVSKFCFVSSIAAIDEQPDQKIITEDNEWNIEQKHHGYAITKYGAEMEVWRASQEGLNIVIVNPGVILGAGFWKTGSGKLFSSVAKGFKYYTEGITGFISVGDVVKSMINLMESTIKNERFILVAENKSFKEVLHAIAESLHVKKPSVKATPLMSAIAWRIDWVKSFLTGGERQLTRYTAKSGHYKNYYSANKLKETIQIDFKPIDTSIKEICKYYKKEVKT